MTGAVIERTVRGVDMGVNIDYWAWDGHVKDLFESKSSVGCAVYAQPDFGNVSIPVRLEYIHHQGSNIYMENASTGSIVTATITPTYRYCENAYFRAEATYVDADGAFADKDGNRKNGRISLAMEVGYLF